MKTNRGTEIGYPETQNMLEELRRKQTALANSIEAPESACRPLTTTNPNEISTGLTVQYDIQVLNELVFVLGEG